MVSEEAGAGVAQIVGGALRNPWAREDNVQPISHKCTVLVLP